MQVYACTKTNFPPNLPREDTGLGVPRLLPVKCTPQTKKQKEILTSSGGELEMFEPRILRSVLQHNHDVPSQQSYIYSERNERFWRDGGRGSRTTDAGRSGLQLTLISSESCTLTIASP